MSTVALGGDFVAVGTDADRIRVYSLSGLQLRILSVSGESMFFQRAVLSVFFCAKRSFKHARAFEF